VLTINNWLNADFVLVNARGAAIDGNVSGIIDDHAINEGNECYVGEGTTPVTAGEGPGEEGRTNAVYAT